MKIVFFGTSAFAARIISYLLSQNIEVAAVVTRPDRPRGRALQLSFSPVKELIQQIRPDLHLHQPEKASTPEFAKILSEYNADLFVVVAYGEIIKTNILSLPKLGCINIHASILPKYRGAAPIQRTLMSGDPVAGVTIMEMVLEMDAGAIIKIVETPLNEETTYGELELTLSEIASPALLEVIKSFESGTVKKTPQDPSKVTFAPKITAKEEQIDWNKPAINIHNLIRALSPKPGAWCQVIIGGQPKRLKIKKSQVISGVKGNPGDILSFGKEGWTVACGSDGLKLLEVQLEGKKALSADDFIKGVRQSISLAPAFN